MWEHEGPIPPGLFGPANKNGDHFPASMLTPAQRAEVLRQMQDMQQPKNLPPVDDGSAKRHYDLEDE
jgi:hypothetical protein